MPKLRLSSGEKISLITAVAGLAISLLIYGSGISFVAFRFEDDSVAPNTFDGQYKSVDTPPIVAAPNTGPALASSTPSAVEAVASLTSATPIIAKSTATEQRSNPSNSPSPTPPVALKNAPVQGANALTPSSGDERIFMVFPGSQALLTHTGVSAEKAYLVHLQFEIQPPHTHCRLILKKGEEPILTEELDGNDQGSYEVEVSLKEPALYKWQIFTRNNQSPERLFTVRK